MHRQVRLRLTELSEEADEISELIEAYTGDASERTTLMRVSRHLKLHQISAANLLDWLERVGADLIPPEDVKAVQEKLRESSNALEKIVRDGE